MCHVTETIRFSELMRLLFGLPTLRAVIICLLLEQLFGGSLPGVSGRPPEWVPRRFGVTLEDTLGSLFKLRARLDHSLRA